MTRILHRSYIDKNKYFLSAILFGLMLSWGESLLIWIPLPFTAGLNEIISLNLVAILLGAFTGLITSLFSYYICKFMVARGKFGSEIHQTAWAFSLTVAMMIVAMIIGGIVGGNNVTRFIIILLIAPTAFILVYEFSVMFLFKKHLAGRITLEAMLVLFVLIYFVKHPGPPKEVPLTNPQHPHFFIFHIPNLPFGIEGKPTLADCVPEKRREGLTEFQNAFAVVRNVRSNVLELFRHQSENHDNLLTVLKDYDYHLGLFSVHQLPKEMRIEEFDIIDNQTFSLKSRHSLFNFYDRILPFVNLNFYARKLDGYPQDQRRDPSQLNERLLNMIKRKRDENPFFIFSSYAPVPKTPDSVKSTGEIALTSLLHSLDKMGILEYSYFIFTDLTRNDLHKPLIVLAGGSYFDSEFQEIPASYYDITLTIANLITRSGNGDYFARDLREIINGEVPIQRPVYAWENKFSPEQPAIMVCVYPWKLVHSQDGNYVLTNLTDGFDPNEDLSSKHPEIVKQLGALLVKPQLLPPDFIIKTDKLK